MPEEIIAMLEREHRIAVAVLQYLLSDDCSLSPEVKSCLRNIPFPQSGSNSFYIDITRTDLKNVPTFEDEFTFSDNDEDVKMLVEVSTYTEDYDETPRKFLFVYYREEPKAKAYKLAQDILAEKAKNNSNKIPSEWSLDAAQQMRTALSTCRWSLSEFHYIASLYKELIELEGGSLAAGYLSNGGQASDHVNGTKLYISCSCSASLNSIVVNCLRDIFAPHIRQEIANTSPDDDMYSIYWILR